MATREDEVAWMNAPVLQSAALPRFASVEQIIEKTRPGEPTYVIYPIAKGAPDVLPELLTKDIVLNALKKDVQQ